MGDLTQPAVATGDFKVEEHKKFMENDDGMLKKNQVETSTDLSPQSSIVSSPESPHTPSPTCHLVTSPPPVLRSNRSASDIPPPSNSEVAAYLPDTLGKDNGSEDKGELDRSQASILEAKIAEEEDHHTSEVEDEDTALVPKDKINRCEKSASSARFSNDVEDDDTDDALQASSVITSLEEEAEDDGDEGAPLSTSKSISCDPKPSRVVCGQAKRGVVLPARVQPKRESRGQLPRRYNPDDFLLGSPLKEKNNNNNMNSSKNENKNKNKSKNKK